MQIVFRKFIYSSLPRPSCNPFLPLYFLSLLARLVITERVNRALCWESTARKWSS